MKKKDIFKSIVDWAVFLLSGQGEIAKQGVAAGILSFEGQGRDKYGN
jgi:hypothetical protein